MTKRSTPKAPPKSATKRRAPHVETTPENSLHVGEAIKQARLAQHMTQAEVGERMGVQRSQISRIEKGKSITLTSLMRIFQALGVPVTLEMQGIGRVALC